MESKWLIVKAMHCSITVRKNQEKTTNEMIENIKKDVGYRRQIIKKQ